MNVLDLFSGIGGFSLGLERAGFKTVAFCEIEPYCRAVLRRHWPDVRQYDDVRTLTAEQLAADGIAVDVICGGFPCQDISVAGKGAGITGERSGLWKEYARLIGELRPRYVIVENVAALLGRGMGVVLGDLAEIGYDAEWHCISAADVGARHLRERIWIVGYPEHIGFNAAEVTGSIEAGIHDSKTWPQQTGEFARPDQQQPFVADADVKHGKRRGESQQPNSEAGASWHKSKRRGKPFAYACIERLEVQRALASRIESQLNDAGNDCRWEPEPAVGRVVNGVPRRVDRLKGLGNAVVPQIPEIIGRAIMQAAGEMTNQQAAQPAER